MIKSTMRTERYQVPYYVGAYQALDGVDMLSECLQLGRGMPPAQQAGLRKIDRS